MNTPNPLVPQGALERQSKGKSTVRIAIFTIVSIHAVFFAGLLIQGCRQDESKTPLKSAEAATNQNTLPSIENTYYTATQDMGQVLSPAPVPSPTAQTAYDPASTLPSPTIGEPVPEGKSYTIAKGDSFSRIASAHGTTVAALTRANPAVDPARLKPGQKIQLPVASPNAPRAASVAETGKTEPMVAAGSSHTVKAGDTLTRIAKQHRTTVRAIRAANHLKSDRLLVGQKLKLPASSASATESRMSSVAGVDSAKPAHLNPLASNSR